MVLQVQTWVYLYQRKYWFNTKKKSTNCTEVIMSDSMQLFYLWEILNIFIICMLSAFKRYLATKMLKLMYMQVEDINLRQ
jgi:hypothetical protein